MKNNLIKAVFIYILISFAVLLSMSYGVYLCVGGLELRELFEPLDLLLAQISNTFIVLSLTSVLSTNIGTVYWEDIKDIKLVSPFWYCFLAIAVYLLVALGFSFIAYVFKYDAGLISSFIASIILLVFLTFRLIGVYFGDEAIRKQLKQKYQLSMLDAEGSYYNYRKILERMRTTVDKKDKKLFLQIERRYEKFNSIEQDDFDSLESAQQIENYNFYKEKLKEKTIQALNNSDFGVVEQNLNLLAEVSDAAVFMDIVDAIIPANANFASEMLLKYRNKFDTVYQIQISDLSKNILHNLAEGSYSLNTIKKLVWTIRGERYNTEKYKAFYSEFKNLEAEYKDIAQEFVHYSIQDMKDEELRDYYKRERSFKKEYKSKFDDFFINNRDCILGESYKPVYELYDAYLKKNFNLVMLYLEIIKEDKAYINTNIGTFVEELGESHEMRYLSDEQYEVVDMIIKLEEQNGFLTSGILKQIQGLGVIVIGESLIITQDALDIYKENI